MRITKGSKPQYLRSRRQHSNHQRMLGGSSPHMSPFGSRLMHPAKARPPQALGLLLCGLTRQVQQATQFWHTQFDAPVLTSAFFLRR